MKRFMIAALCAVCLTGCGDISGTEVSSDAAESSFAEDITEESSTEETDVPGTTTPTELMESAESADSLDKPDMAAPLEGEEDVPENAAYCRKTTTINLTEDVERVYCQYFDEHDNVIRSVTPFDRVYNYNYVYDEEGRILSSESLIDEEDSEYIVNEYDDSGRLTHTAKYFTKDGPLTCTVDYTYDGECSEPVTISTQYTDENNFDSGISSFTYEFDEKGRVTKRTEDSGTELYYTYDENDNILEYKNIRGGLENRLCCTYDSEGRLTEMEDYNSDGELTLINKYEYTDYE